MSNSERRLRPHGQRQGMSWLIVWALLAATADILAAWLLKTWDLELAARVFVALMPAPFNLFLIILVVKSIRRLDDFQRTLHFEAVALAFVTTALAVLMYGFLQKAHIVGPVNVGLVWVPMMLLYCIGYAVAARHYK